MRTYGFDLTDAAITRVLTITRRDGEVRRFTTWPQAITIGSETWTPGVGVKVFDITERNNGTPASTQLAASVYDDGLFTPQDIADKQYDGAELETDLTDANDPNGAGKSFEFYGRIGSGSKPIHGVITFEARNPYGLPKLNLVPTFTVMCRFPFGGIMCGIDIADFQNVCTIATVPDRHNMTLTAHPFAGDVDGWYAPGKIKFTSGRNKNRIIRIGAWNQATKGLTTWLPAGLLTAVGDTAIIWPDCDKTIAMCVGKYANGRRYGGFRYFEGAKAVASAG